MPRERNDLYARALGVSLRAMRKYKNWSVTEVGRRIGVSRSAVSSWEEGRGSPSWSHLVAISGVFNIKLSNVIIAVEKTAATLEQQNDPTTQPTAATNNAQRKSLGASGD